MNTKPKINGIRLNKNFIQLTQKKMQEQLSDTADMPALLYKILDDKRVNMIFMTLNNPMNESGNSFISGTIAAKHLKQTTLQKNISSSDSMVSIISIYPHHYRLKLPGYFLSLLGQQKIPFQYMLSSGSMLTLITNQDNCDRLVHMLSEEFDLPESHVPFEQSENEELTQFLKKKYPETRASYVEEKIKTYGIKLISDLTLSYYMLTSYDALAEYGTKIEHMADKNDTFSYLSAYMDESLQTQLFLINEKKLDIPASKTLQVDMLSFHGPHFGDRHSIAACALNCLSQHSVPVLHTGCTGASITIIVPQNKGKEAQRALMDVFEAP